MRIVKIGEFGEAERPPPPSRFKPGQKVETTIAGKKATVTFVDRPMSGLLKGKDLFRTDAGVVGTIATVFDRKAKKSQNLFTPVPKETIEQIERAVKAAAEAAKKTAEAEAKKTAEEASTFVPSALSRWALPVAGVAAVLGGLWFWRRRKARTAA